MINKDSGGIGAYALIPPFALGIYENIRSILPMPRRAAFSDTDDKTHCHSLHGDIIADSEQGAGKWDEQ